MNYYRWELETGNSIIILTPEGRTMATLISEEDDGLTEQVKKDAQDIVDALNSWMTLHA